MMDAIVTSLQKNGKDSVMNGVAKLRVQNMVIASNAHIRRKDGTKNDLPLHAATDNLRHWRSCGEVVNKTMNTQQEAKFLSYMQRIAQAAENIAKYYENVPHIKMPEYDISIDDNIQHVGYDDAQLGREK